MGEQELPLAKVMDDLDFTENYCALLKRGPLGRIGFVLFLCSLGMSAVLIKKPPKWHEGPHSFAQLRLLSPGERCILEGKALS